MGGEDVEPAGLGPVLYQSRFECFSKILSFIHFFCVRMAVQRSVLVFTHKTKLTTEEFCKIKNFTLYFAASINFKSSFYPKDFLYLFAIDIKLLRKELFLLNNCVLNSKTFFVYYVVFFSSSKVISFFLSFMDSQSLFMILLLLNHKQKYYGKDLHPIYSLRKNKFIY